MYAKGSTSEAFAAFKLVQSMSTAIGFIKLSYFYSQCMMISLFICAVLGYVALEYGILTCRIGKPRSQSIEELPALDQQ